MYHVPGGPGSASGYSLSSMLPSRRVPGRSSDRSPSPAPTRSHGPTPSQSPSLRAPSLTRTRARSPTLSLRLSPSRLARRRGLGDSEPPESRSPLRVQYCLSSWRRPGPGPPQQRRVDQRWPPATAHWQLRLPVPVTVTVRQPDPEQPAPAAQLRVASLTVRPRLRPAGLPP